MIAIASDHAGFRQKEYLVAKLLEEGYQLRDLGCSSIDSVDYPDFAAKVAREIQQGAAGVGVLICGSGEGMVMAANRFPGVRAGLAWNTEIAALLRQHNNAQIICFGARFTADAYAWLMLKTFLNSQFEGGNHAVRLEKMNQIG